MKLLVSLMLFIGLFMTQTVSISAQNNAEAGLDNIFRTSDADTETATQPNRRKGQRTQALPEGSERVGCICMTGAVRGTTGIGSCSGQGGVRYWLVENAEGDTVQYPTARQALNGDNEPVPYVGPSPESRAAAQPTIIFMPPQGNGFFYPTAEGTPQYKTGLDSQIVIFQPQFARNDSVYRQGADPTALLGLPLIFNSLIQLCMIMVVCGTLVIVIKLFLNQGSTEATSSNKIFRNIRLTLIKILFKNNRFFK